MIKYTLDRETQRLDDILITRVETYTYKFSLNVQEKNTFLNKEQT